MKKNFAMRIAACLLMVTMLSLCMVSYTYAKYTTTGSDNKVAQVAKWGVEVTAQLEDLFAKGYNSSNVVDEAQATATVLTSGTANMLAPGTTDHTAAALKVEGTPEVAVEIDYTLNIELSNWSTDLTDDASKLATEYCPLVITIDSNVRGTAKSQTFQIDGSAIKTVAELIAAVEEYVDETFDIEASKGERVDPNVSLATTINVSWSWAFNGDDAKDTALGDNAADGNPATFSITLGATVTQID